jgi:hypothetical protein
MNSKTETATRFNVGDVIVGWGVVREITAVRDSGYEWRYPDQGEICASGHINSFMSENSSDPFLEVGWRKQ